MSVSTVSALALRYAHDRHAAGFLNDRSAEQTRARLASFVSFAPANPREVRRHHVERWMQQPHLSAAYRRARLSTLRMFCRWCLAHGFMVKDPTLAIDAPRVPDGIPKRLRPDEARALMATASRDRRSQLIVSLMLQEGLRRIEISRLDVEDLDYAERSLLIRSKGGQGAHVDLLPITSETWKILMHYLAEAGHQHGPLVRNRVRKHGRMAPNTISELVHDAMVDAGIKQPGDSSRTPHSCRHTAAHDMLARTKDVRSVQQALRHRSVRSTEIYLRGQVGELRLIMDGRSYTGGDAA